MRPEVEADPRDKRQRVQQALINYGDLVLNRHHGGRSRTVPMT